MAGEQASGTVVATDETGFCLLSDDMVTALREITGSAMASMDAPNVYLLFSTLEWLVFSEPKNIGGLGVGPAPISIACSTSGAWLL